jgi:hypothetical protein
MVQALAREIIRIRRFGNGAQSKNAMAVRGNVKSKKVDPTPLAALRSRHTVL